MLLKVRIDLRSLVLEIEIHNIEEADIWLAVAKHNTAQSCWVVLYGKVYDVSIRYLSRKIPHEYTLHIRQLLKGFLRLPSFSPVILEV